MKSKVLTKAGLIGNLKQQDSSLSSGVATQLTNAFFEEIIFSLQQGECVKFSGLGRFCVRKKEKRLGRNPKTGVDTVISSRKVVLFQASQKLKAKLKNCKVS